MMMNENKKEVSITMERDDGCSRTCAHTTTERKKGREKSCRSSRGEVI